MLEPLRVAIRNALRVEPRGARLDALLQQAHHLIKTRSALKRNDWGALSTALEQAESAMGARSDTAVKEQMGAAAVELRHHEAVRALTSQTALGGVQPTSAVAVLGRLDRRAIETAPLRRGECSFIYRYISHESCSQFDSLPLTSFPSFRRAGT